MTGDDPQSELIPWVRVVRHHANSSKPKSDRSEVLGIDIVHKDFLGTYLNQHALPFADQFAELVLKHHNVLAEARGFVPGMGKDSRKHIEQRLEVARLLPKGKRLQSLFGRGVPKVR